MNNDSGFSQTYLTYLGSDAWKEKRRSLIGATGDFCKECGCNGPSRMPGQPTLDAHHLTYSRFGKETLDDLVLLCRDCHEFEHIRKFGWCDPSESQPDFSTEEPCCVGAASKVKSEYDQLIDLLGDL